jgi:hypothetical protein
LLSNRFWRGSCGTSAGADSNVLAALLSCESVSFRPGTVEAIGDRSPPMSSGGVFNFESQTVLDGQAEAERGGRTAPQFISRVFEPTRVVDQPLPVAVGYVLAIQLAPPQGAIAALGIF